LVIIQQYSSLGTSDPYSAKNLLELAGGDYNFVLELLDAFIEQVKLERTAMTLSAENKDWDDVKFRAHRLRSASGSVGAHQIAGSCAELESYISTSGDIEKSVYLYVEKFQEAISVQLIEIEHELIELKKHRN
jgi:HPt (histidine-containing phosphotransfer) domain-containing protein